MASPRGARTILGALLAAWLSQPVAAQTERAPALGGRLDAGGPARGGRASSSAPHVRCLEPLSCGVLDCARDSSPSVAGLIDYLDRTDVIVWVEAARTPMPKLGDARIVSATIHARFVRVRLRFPGHLPALVGVLGHELQHAVEIADAPHVRRPADLERLYRRIGWPGRCEGCFETKAAIAAGRRAAAEATRDRGLQNRKPKLK